MPIERTEATNEGNHTHEPCEPTKAIQRSEDTYGGHGHTAGGGTGMRVLGSAFAKCSSPTVGTRVVSGVWGKGTVVCVIPRGENPRRWCLRHGFPPLFNPNTPANVFFRRYVVRTDSGEYRTPKKIVTEDGVEWGTMKNLE